MSGQLATLDNFQQRCTILHSAGFLKHDPMYSDKTRCLPRIVVKALKVARNDSAFHTRRSPEQLEPDAKRGKWVGSWGYKRAYVESDDWDVIQKLFPALGDLNHPSYSVLHLHWPQRKTFSPLTYTENPLEFLSEMAVCACHIHPDDVEHDNHVPGRVSLKPVARVRSPDYFDHNPVSVRELPLDLSIESTPLSHHYNQMTEDSFGLLVLAKETAHQGKLAKETAHQGNLVKETAHQGKLAKETVHQGKLVSEWESLLHEIFYLKEQAGDGGNDPEGSGGMIQTSISKSETKIAAALEAALAGRSQRETCAAADQVPIVAGATSAPGLMEGSNQTSAPAPAPAHRSQVRVDDMSVAACLPVQPTIIPAALCGFTYYSKTTHAPAVCSQSAAHCGYKNHSRWRQEMEIASIRQKLSPMENGTRLVSMVASHAAIINHS